MKDFPPNLRYGVPDDAFFDALGEPDGGGQLVENHEFQWLGDPTLEDFLLVYESEWKALQEQSISPEKAAWNLDQDGKYGLKLDWPYDEELWNKLFPFHLIDPGVASSTVALCLHGAMPFSSCVGTSHHLGDFPWVMFWSEKVTLVLIAEVARSAGIDLGYDAGEGQLAQFHLYCDEDPALMRDFAVDLALRYARDHDPSRLQELTSARSQYGEYTVPEWFIKPEEESKT